MIVRKYIRNKHNQKVGCLVAYEVDDDAYVVGWSKCNMSKDIFDKDESFRLAVSRAECAIEGRNIFVAPNGETKFPTSVVDQIAHFTNWSKRYFKGKELINEQSWKKAAKLLQQT